MTEQMLWEAAPEPRQMLRGYLDVESARRGIIAAINDSVDELECIDVLQFLTGLERIRIFNEMHRALRYGGTVTISVPYFSHPQAFANPLTVWPPFSEHSFLFLNKEWRDASESHAVDGLNCDFEMIYAYDVDSVWTTRSDLAKTFAAQHYNGVIVRLSVTLTKRGEPTQPVED